MARRATVLRSSPSRWAKASSRALTSGVTRRLSTGLPSWRAWRWALCWSEAGGTRRIQLRKYANTDKARTHANPEGERRHQIWGSCWVSLSSSGLRTGRDQARRRRSQPGSNRDQGCPAAIDEWRFRETVLWSLFVAANQSDSLWFACRCEGKRPQKSVVQFSEVGVPHIAYKAVLLRSGAFSDKPMIHACFYKSS